MISRRPDRLGRSKWIDRSKRPGRNSAGSRSAARLVAPITRMFDASGGFFCIRRCAGSHRFADVDQPARESACPPVGRVERLQLDQQLVDDARDAFARVLRSTCARTRRCRTAAGSGVERMPLRAPGDRVDLLDEADRAALFARGLAQLLEVVPDLAAGLRRSTATGTRWTTRRGTGTPASRAIALAM